MFVIGAQPSAIMSITVPAELRTTGRTETGLCARNKMFAIIPFVVDDWFFIHKADDFLGNGRRVFAQEMCDFIKSFVLI